MEPPGECRRSERGSDEISTASCKRVNTERSVSNEESTADFGANDYLSRQSTLCLFKIFNHLTRDDIYNMEVVSKRMREIAIDKSLDKIKWKGGKLMVYQTTRGYGFHYTVTHEGYPIALPASFRYETWNENGEIAEERAIDTIYLYRYKEDCKDHGLPIPDEFFAALTIILRRYAITSLKISDIYFDYPNLFERLNSTFKDQKIEHLECANMRCNAMTNVTDEAVKSRPDF